MKNKLSVLAALGMMYAMTESPSSKGTNDGSYGHGIPDIKSKIIPKGCKEFKIHGHTVVALNKKSAFKKVKKLIENIK